MNNTKVFLKNSSVMNKIVDASDLSNDESIVLEIGAGDGRLTELIAEKSKKVYAVEMDLFLLDKAKMKLEDKKNIEFINADILKMEIPDDVNRIISNLPYAISSPITEKVVYFMNSHPKAISILMYQREFADRMLAFPGLHDYSMLSVFVQYLCEIERVMNVSRVNFRPMPEVDSTVIKLRPKKVTINESFLRLCRLLFQHKNKNLYGSILDSRNEMKIKSKEQIRKVIKDKGLDETLLNRKVFTLTIEELLDIHDKLSECGIW